MSNDNKYFDTETHLIVTAYKAKEYTQFFNAVFGPHGSAQPDQWVVSDACGFRLAFDEDAFHKRFTQIKMQTLSWKAAGEKDFPNVLCSGYPCPPEAEGSAA